MPISNLKFPIALSLVLTAAAWAGPATQPATDPSMDWLLSQATTAPSVSSPGDLPSTQPSVLTGGPAADDSARAGSLKLSNGQSVSGQLSTTLDQPIRVWVESEKQYHDIPFSLIKSMDAQVVWERDEQDWKFKESGSDIKEYSGKTYPARETSYTVTLNDGQTVTGSVSAPIYLRTPDGKKVYVLHQRDKGEAGQTLKDLVYVQRVEFAPG
jgi:hypothetical protein